MFTFLEERTRRLLATLTAVALLAGLSVIGILAPAQAAVPTNTVAGGKLTWGVIQDYRTVFPASAFMRSATDGATFVNDNAVFPASTTSTWDGVSGSLAFTGSARIGYVSDTSGTSGNYISIASPTIAINGTSGTLSANSVSKSHGQGPEAPAAVRQLATLDLKDAVKTDTATTVSWTGVKVVLVEGAIAVFPKIVLPDSYDAREAGDRLDDLSITLEKSTTTTTVRASAISSAVGSDVTFTATVEPAATGTVTFSGGGISATVVTVVDGSASLSTSGLVEGSATITATYSGSPSAAPSDGSVTHTVTATPTPVSAAFPTISAPTTSLGSVTWKVSSRTWTYYNEKSVTGGVTVSDASGFTLPVTEVVTSGTTSDLKLSGAFRFTWHNTHVTGDPVYYWLQFEDLSMTVDAAGNGTLKGAVSWDSLADEISSSSKQIVSIATFTVDPATLVGDGIARTSLTQVFTSEFTTYLVATGQEGHFVASGPTDAKAEAKKAAPLALVLNGTDVPETGTPGTGTPGAETPGTGTPGTETPGAGTPVPSAKGQLIWGVKASFTTYITKGAAGAITVSGGAATSGAVFTFNQTSKDFNGSTGTVGYAGTVHFTGHAGVLDLQLINPRIKITGPTTAILIVDVVGKALDGASVTNSGVEFATLTLDTPTTDGGVTTWTNAAATITAAGSEAFSGFIQAGTALDPVSFTIGADTVAGETPVTPPATTVAPLAAGTYPNATANVPTALPGGEVTVTGTGFGANTTGIELAVYSVRQVLATGLTADANGTVTATVTLPKNLAAGVHTLSFEANGVKSQVTITVEAPAPAAKQCVANAVSGATLSWGVKSSFRNYITSPTANGSITTSGVSDSGSAFRWTAGTGKFNTEVNQGRVAYAGSVHFSGHGGLLDLTISNVRIQVNSASTASLIADVSSTSIDGVKSNQSGIALASLSLSGTKSTSGSTVTWTNAAASLTAAGAKAFSGFYEAGDALDPVTFSFPLGATVECDASSGALAATGADGLADAALLALAAMAFGLSLVMVARRRRPRVKIG
ncbi:Htaa protein [Sanguibacter gelidistatuariae]|uniref:Htaa protein n=1 Tax=Sanguibacter gelidistatuariae TaxID=1814289 RepID=A0A1G6HCF9_9MICO|nr:HtaA domain-containing protein [Sanguibacter gelidistatuariae]SDB91881.1 Htaa protein [Sanguibacter gelidistatuariae]